MKIKTTILIITGAAVLALLGLEILGYFAEKPETVQPETSKKPEIKVTSFIGKIVELDQDEIKIQVSDSQNQGVEKNNMILVIRINQETRFIERETLKQIPQGKSPADLIKQKEIAFADLKIGDDVIASAAQNIAWQKEFTAQYVLRIKLAE